MKSYGNTCESLMPFSSTIAIEHQIVFPLFCPPTVLPLAFVAIISAAPAKEADDLSVAEGRHVPSYGAAPYGGPVAYAPPAAPKYGAATVTSYNRRGSYAQASEYSKPTIYGSSYAQPSIRSSSYSAGPSAYGPASHGYASQELSYPAPSAPVAYGGYGPQTNAYSAQSQHLSQDPAYDPSKDPVSQYAAYIPVREYSPKSHSNGNELSIYGYRK
ncbi:hypothetical protein AVEN_259176-1 [Araneus ventricosus]|uniref:Uncharacterized protein n=1 Tax=Araneus ventricosus TaxID=182803 RepID=A0A4Y2KVK3_ARAVE|nr:hypothetical protein AVEN_259176-1 [Araneus ventricosus]